jgi:hypothetical protein
MNFYPTRYSELSNSEVNELYRSQNWDGMNRDERLDALQELENRSAAMCGNQPCEVFLEQMNGARYGYYHNGEIYVNESLVEHGEFVARYEDGTAASYAPADANVQLMDTIHHENYHAYQSDAINGIVEHDNAAEVELWRANWDNNNYISGGDPLYRVQSLEKSAFEHGEAQTKAAFEEIEAKYGTDAAYREYLDSISENSYENALANAKELYADENIEVTLNEQMVQNYQANHIYSYSQILSNEDGFVSAAGNIAETQEAYDMEYDL